MFSISAAGLAWYVHRFVSSSFTPYLLTRSSTKVLIPLIPVANLLQSRVVETLQNYTLNISSSDNDTEYLVDDPSNMANERRLWLYLLCVTGLFRVCMPCALYCPNSVIR